MGQYERLMLSRLLDTYEASVLSVGLPQRTVHIEMRFTKKNMPAYFQESTNTYELIHRAAEQLEQMGLIAIFWKGGRPGHIIEKIRLCEAEMERAYEMLRRTPKAGMEQSLINLLRIYGAEAYEDAPVCNGFARFLTDRLQQHQSVKSYVDVGQPEQAKNLLEIVACIERNEIPCFLREFSILHLGDSKEMERLSGKLTKIFRKFRSDWEEMEFRDILAEYQIYHTPNYVYLKGCGQVHIGMQTIDLAALHQGIGFSDEDLPDMHFVFPEEINRVITVENLTSFFRMREEKALIVYLGGYHNRIRRELLRKIYETAPRLDFYHFGDIDAGGFAIHRHLCEKTGIPFRRIWMDFDTLKTYESYSKPLTAGDRTRLARMILDDALRQDEELHATIRYMLERNIKLEQECIGVEIPRDAF